MTDDVGQFMEELFERLQERTAVSITPEEYVATTAEMSIIEIVNSLSGIGEPESKKEDCESTLEADISTDEAKETDEVCPAA